MSDQDEPRSDADEEAAPITPGEAETSESVEEANDAENLPEVVSAAWSKFIGYFIDGKLVVFILVALLIGAGFYVLPFQVDDHGIDRDPVPVDAIPDIGENQQIVFTEWAGRSPRDVEDQVTYPLTTALLGIPGVKTVRSFSAFGFSSIYVIFDEASTSTGRARACSRSSPPCPRARSRTTSRLASGRTPRRSAKSIGTSSRATIPTATSSVGSRRSSFARSKIGPSAIR